MRIPRTEADLLQLIRDKVEESVFLDYKRAEALSGKGDLTREVSKDVSSFANSAGGVLIYGIAEGGAESKHLPDAISPLDRNKFSKERLEHLIGNIQPKISNIEIVPIALSTDSKHVAYVVAIPASTTAHQCTDKRYYRRHNFESVAMEDYEIRDVMNRRSLARIQIEAEIRFFLHTWTGAFPSLPILRGQEPTITPEASLSFRATNTGGVVAKHLVAFVEIPPGIIKDYNEGGRFQLRNFKRQPTGRHVVMGVPEMGDPHWNPILPSLSLDLEDYELSTVFPFDLSELNIPWTAHCDDAPARDGIFTKANIGLIVEEDYREWLDRQDRSADRPTEKRQVDGW